MGQTFLLSEWNDPRTGMRGVFVMVWMPTGAGPGSFMVAVSDDELVYCFSVPIELE